MLIGISMLYIDLHNKVIQGLKTFSAARHIGTYIYGDLVELKLFENLILVINSQR